MPFNSTNLDQESTTWRALTLFSSYRFLLAVVLFFSFYLELPSRFLGTHDPWFYTVINQLYILIALALLNLTVKRRGDIDTTIKLHLLVDIVAITLLIHASGGLETGLGSLLVIVVVVGGALIPGRTALFIAAIATLAVLIEVSFSRISQSSDANYSQAGILGAAFFVTAWLAQWFSRKMEASKELAEQHARDVANLAVLNQHIISRMQIGVLALDTRGRVTLLNQSAKTMLGIEQLGPGFMLKERVPELAKQIWLWQNRHGNSFTPFQARSDLPELRASTTKLDSGEILVFVENTTAMARQLQQLKLASLGRLTASIAHEIRNPLGAISHAGELLDEQAGQEPTVAKLIAIIQRHSQRINIIIETILQMSRRKDVEPSQVVLAVWLEHFIQEFSDIHHLEQSDIVLQVEAPLAVVAMDAEQLHQVVANLMDNALHFSHAGDGARITARLTGTDSETRLDIIDNGEGVPESVQENLFEPFHSDRKEGTGLGLYLARELCQANGARLGYLGKELEYSCFRISFPNE